MAPQAMARLLVDAPEPMRALVARALLASVEAHSRDPYEVRNGAILALGAIGRSGSAPLDQEIRRDLERLAFRSGGARLTGYLATVALAQAASRAGEGELPFEGLEPTRKALLRQLTLSRGQTLCWNALALGLLEERAAERGKVPSSDSAAALRTVLRRNRSSEVLGAAAIALGLMRDVEAQELLVARMSEAGEQHARGYAALALGMIGAHGAREAVLAALEASTQQPFALEQVGIALSLLGDQVTGLRLFELLDLDPSPELQVALASALGWIQDPRPLVPLCGRVADRGLSRHARAWSAVAVGRICDVDDPAWVGRVSVGVNYDVALRTLIDPEYGTGLLDQP
jgi:HEAT repeat protein